MKLSKNQTRGIISLVLLLAAFNVLAFVIPFARERVFWWAYGFTTASILAQGYVFWVSMRGDAKSRFYGFPIARIGVIYLVVQLILGFAGMACASFCPTAVGVVLYVLVFVLAGAGILITETVRDEIQQQDVQLKVDVKTMRAVQSKIYNLSSEDEALKKALEELADTARYSDPVSAPEIADIEAELVACVDELQAALVENNTADALALSKKALATLIERNRLCKLNKSNR